MGFALLTECLGKRVETAKRAHDVRIFYAELTPSGTQCNRIRGLFWSIATVAATMIGRTNSSATSMSDRAKTWSTMCHHHTDSSLQLALDADAVRWRVRLATMQIGTDDLDELMFVDGAAIQLEVNGYMGGDRSRGVEYFYILWRRVNNRNE